MTIRYLGHSSFLMESNAGVRIVTDPYGDVGLKFPRIQADCVTVSHSHYDHCFVAGVLGEPKVLDKAGEFSLSDVKISSIERAHDDCGGKKRGKNLVFFFDFGDVTVCHLGDLGEPCSQELCEKIGRVDVLFLPVGGNYTIGAKEAVRYLDALNPRYAVPMHYFVKGLTVDIAPPDEFLRLCKERSFGVTEVKEFPVEKVAKGEGETARPSIIFMERSKI